MNYRYFVIVLFVVLSSGISYSQQLNCGNVILEAEEMYRKGIYEEPIQLLNSYLKACRLSKLEKEEAYILQTQAYLEIGNYKEGILNGSYKTFLKNGDKRRHYFQRRNFQKQLFILETT